jgi:hypothetical protein
MMRVEPTARSAEQMALLVWQPWAYLLVTGVKDVENRTWGTAHRGRLWIHASQRFDAGAYRALRAAGVDLPELPRGALVGAVELIACVHDSQSEWAEPGQGHWQMAQHWELPRPIPTRGRQRLFPVRPPEESAAPCGAQPHSARRVTARVLPIQSFDPDPKEPQP